MWDLIWNSNLRYHLVTWHFFLFYRHNNKKFHSQLCRIHTSTPLLMQRFTTMVRIVFSWGQMRVQSVQNLKSLKSRYTFCLLLSPCQKFDHRPLSYILHPAYFIKKNKCRILRCVFSVCVLRTAVELFSSSMDKKGAWCGNVTKCTNVFDRLRKYESTKYFMI